MRRALPLAVLAVTLAMTGEAAAFPCLSQATGDWSDAGTWSGCGGGVPDSGDGATILSPHEVENDVATTVAGLGLQDGATLTTTADLAVSGAFTTDGGLITGDATLTVAGLLTKSWATTLTVQSGADLVVNGGGTLADGDISLDNGTMHVNSTLTIPDGNSEFTYINGSMPSGEGPALLVGPSGVIVEQDTTATVTFISATYENDGEIRAEAGSLTLDRDGAGETSDGDFRAELGGQIRLEPGAATLVHGSGAALEGPGSVRLSNGVLNLGNGAEITAGELEVWGTLNVTGAGTYAPGTLKLGPFNESTVNSTRNGSAGALNTERGSLLGNHTFAVGTFSKSSANELVIADGADLVVNGPASQTDGNVCLRENTPGVSGDPSLQVNGAYTFPASISNVMTCNQGTDDTAHLVVGAGGSLDPSDTVGTQIHTRTLVAGGTVAPSAIESLGFSNELGMSSGAITAPAGGGITADEVDVSGGTVTIGAGGELFSSSAPLTLTGGVLTGTGEVKGDGVLNSGGTVAPGSSPGTLTVDGPFTQGSGGTLAIEVDGPGAGQFDVLAVTGAATLAGTVAVDVGSSPADSDVIQFLTSASRSGTFGSLTGAGLSGARSFSLEYPAGAPFGARLAVVQPPLPSAGTPTIGGTPEPGQTLSCDPGSWGSVASFSHEWLRGGQVVAGGQTYAVTEDDRGHQLTCRVTGSNATGSSQATSAPVGVPAPAAAPPAPAPSPAPAPTPAVTTGGPTPQEIRLGSASRSTVAKALGLPARRCLSRRRFTIRLREPAGVRLESARITVAGKRVRARRRSGRMNAVVDLRGLRRGRYTVSIVARTVAGTTLRGKRRYRTCAARRRSGRVREL